MRQALVMMMAGTVFGLIGAGPVSAADTSFARWVPSGWKLLHQAQGDLDGAGGRDAVLVLEQTDPARRVPNAHLGPAELNLNQRRLLVLVDGGKGLAKAIEQDGVLPSEHDSDQPCLEDPLHEEDAVVIRNRTLRLTEHSWTSCGSYGTSREAMIFRLEPDGKRLRLIGLDYSDMMRNSGEASETSVNYLSGRRKRVTGLNAFDPAENRPKTTWSRISRRTPLYMDEMVGDCGAEHDVPAWCNDLQ